MQIAIISDIHSNLEALKAVLKVIEKLRIQKIFCLGDVVGYGANPCECVKIIQQKEIPTLVGNHDYASVCGATSWFNPAAAYAIRWTSAKLHRKELGWLGELKEKFELKFGEYHVLLVHGSPSDPVWQYVFPYEVDENFGRKLEYDALFMGHTHVQFTKKIGKKLIANVGSVGQPRDKDPRACFVIFDDEKFSVKAVRVEYDIKSAADKIIKEGLPKMLADRLFLGM